jgi:hypothetical protein
MEKTSVPNSIPGRPDPKHGEELGSRISAIGHAQISVYVAVAARRKKPRNVARPAGDSVITFEVLDEFWRLS